MISTADSELMVEGFSKKALFLLFVVSGPTFTPGDSKHVHAFKTHHVRIEAIYRNVSLGL